MKIKLRVGDTLYEPMSQNIGEITKVLDHPSGKIVIIRWIVDGHVPHETEFFYKKVLRSIKNGEMEHTPKGSLSTS